MRVPVPEPARAPFAPPLIEAVGVVRTFRDRTVLDGVDLRVRAGEIHALLGPNGAGKTTLLRIMAGLVDPTSGYVSILGSCGAPRDVRRSIGWVPSGDRTFYLRMSGLENLAFFARLYGLSRRAAVDRAHEVLDAVGLSDAATRRVGQYSHGMQKRLSFARALLTDARVLLIDEATHDLDPEGARQVCDLVRGASARGAAVVWATQRVDEMRDLATSVTVLAGGAVRFTGSVDALIAHTPARRYVVTVRDGQHGDELLSVLQRAVLPMGTIGGHESHRYVLALAPDAVLGDAIAALTGCDVQVLACREVRSEMEEALLHLTGGER